MKKSPEYAAFNCMRQRCLNPKNPSFVYYGARGISVAPEFRTFEGFFAVLGLKPSPRHSLDRIENTGDYAPGNVRWATKRTQMLNRSDNRLLTHAGETMTLTEWSERTGIRVATLWLRLTKWPVDRALTAKLYEKSAAGHMGAAARWKR